MLLRVHHAEITIPRGAEDEARKFYCELLGLREIPKPEALRGRGGFWLELGQTQVHIGAEDGVDRNATKAHIAYEVDDIEAWRTRLEEYSVKTTEGIPIPGIVRFEFRDPFGNRVEFLAASRP
jgi:catechol 2,3-dioxygenase-like lactoylglutathione lyase family enzyme